MANQFREFLKIINIETIKSRKVVVIKLTNHASLQKMISFVVYSSDRITSYSVNMVRWAGRASMVIMNQEENDLNIDTSEGDKDVNYAALDAALGDTRLCKSLFKAAIYKLFWENLFKLFTTLIVLKWHDNQHDRQADHEQADQGVAAQLDQGLGHHIVDQKYERFGGK